ncbi:MAG: glycosyltransferase [Candidatus Omnitrophota bacterium]|jgi:glycosyltransferase involved in cell wall biosynthesis
MTPSVSVIMNCYNSAKFLREAIDSVYGQAYKDWEIVFWDNASTDNSAEIAKSYDDKVKYFRGETNVQLGHARNLAIEKARGKYIAFLDCDDVWLGSKLEKEVKVLDEKKDVGLVYSNYYRLYSGKRKKIKFRRPQPEGDVFERFFYAYPVGLLTAVVRKSDLDRLDTLFDEKLYLWEQYDVFMRLLYKSKAAYVNEPLALYRVHEGSGTVKLMFTEKYPDELAYIIEKFKRMDPLFASKYSNALAKISSKVEFLRAKAEVAQGNPAKAREILKKCRWYDYKYFVLYLLTSLPKSMMKAILRYHITY